MINLSTFSYRGQSDRSGQSLTQKWCGSDGFLTSGQAETDSLISTKQNLKYNHQEQRGERKCPTLPPLPLTHCRWRRSPSRHQSLLQVLLHTYIHSQKIFMKLKHFPQSVRRRPEPAPAQYLVEGSCTLPRIDGIQGYTLPR